VKRRRGGKGNFGKRKTPPPKPPLPHHQHDLICQLARPAQTDAAASGSRTHQARRSSNHCRKSPDLGDFRQLFAKVGREGSEAGEALLTPTPPSPPTRPDLSARATCVAAADAAAEAVHSSSRWDRQSLIYAPRRPQRTAGITSSVTACTRARHQRSTAVVVSLLLMSRPGPIRDNRTRGKGALGRPPTDRSGEASRSAADSAHSRPAPRPLRTHPSFGTTGP
jgi:hypothetical protein